MLRTRGLRHCSLGRPDLPPFKSGVPAGTNLTPVNNAHALSLAK
jgi:hypothetical protein